MESQGGTSMVSPSACAFSSFAVMSSHGLPTGTVVSTGPTIVPVLVDRTSSANPAAIVNMAPPVYPWAQSISSQWHFPTHNPSMANFPANIYMTDHATHPQPPSIDWYEYEPTSHSYETTDHVNVDIPTDPELAHHMISSEWDNLQEWAFDLWAEDEDDNEYPSKRLQRMAWDLLRTARPISNIAPNLDDACDIADVDVWRGLADDQRRKDETGEHAADDTPPLPKPIADYGHQRNHAKREMDQGRDEMGIEIVLPDMLPPIPSCETLLLPQETSDNANCCPPAPISYAAASTPRNAAETIAAYMNRSVKMHLIAANAPLTESFPLRHRMPKRMIIDPPKPQPIDLGTVPVDPLSVCPPQQLHGLDAMAALARRNSFGFRQLNGGLLLIPFAQDEHRYCIGSSSAGRMLIGVEKLSPPRLYANDCRTICLKKVSYTEDCDKVWCRLNLFRKQIGAEKSAARRNNVAVYELFARSEQFAYFGRLPYKWNLDQYFHSDHYANTVTNHEKEGLRILRGVANGLAYVHRGDFRLFHGNLKPSNVLISTDGSVFLTDYGFGRICCPMWSGAAAHRFCRDSETGTFDPLCWKAYEFFSGCGSMAIMQAAHTSPSMSRETPHRQADVFSAALLGYYAVTSGHSHPLIDGDEAYRKTLHFYRQRIDRFTDFVQLHEITDPTARRLVSTMLELDVKQRPDARYVADHPAFWNEKKRNDFLIAVAELVCASEKMTPSTGINAAHSQSPAISRVLSAKKLNTLSFVQRLNSTPENVAKIAARFGVKIEEASMAVALKTFYRQHGRATNGGGGEKQQLNDELEPLWNELAAEIYDVVYPVPPLKLKQFFTK